MRNTNRKLLSRGFIAFIVKKKKNTNLPSFDMNASKQVARSLPCEELKAALSILNRTYGKEPDEEMKAMHEAGSNKRSSS